MRDDIIYGVTVAISVVGCFVLTWCPWFLQPFQNDFDILNQFTHLGIGQIRQPLASVDTTVDPISKSRYLSHYWPRSVSPYDVTDPQCVKSASTGN